MAEAWKEFEKDSGALFGAKRFWANSGERTDFEGQSFVGQCKLVKSLSLEKLTQLAEEMEAKCGRSMTVGHKMGVVCVKVRRGRGRESAPLAVLTFSQMHQLLTYAQKGGLPMNSTKGS